MAFLKKGLPFGTKTNIISRKKYEQVIHVALARQVAASFVPGNGSR